jgi:hypothetical protein
MAVFKTREKREKTKKIVQNSKKPEKNHQLLSTFLALFASCGSSYLT